MGLQSGLSDLLTYVSPVLLLGYLESSQIEADNKIIDKCEEIKQTDGIFGRVCCNFLKRLNMGIEEDGQHFDDLLRSLKTVFPSLIIHSTF